MLRLIALLATASALFVLVPAGQASYSQILGLAKGQFETTYWPTLFFMLALNVILPGLKLICSYGLFSLSRWARKSTIMVMGCEILLRAFAVGKFFYYNSSLLSEGSTEKIFSSINIIPTAVIISIDLICILYLTRRKAKLLDVKLEAGTRHRSL